MSQDDIIINPTNFLQSKMAYKSTYRTSEERFDFLWENFKMYVRKNLIKFDGMNEYL